MATEEEITTNPPSPVHIPHSSTTAMDTEEEITTNPPSPVHIPHSSMTAMDTAEETTTKPPSPVHLPHSLPSEKDSNTPLAPPQLVVETPATNGENDVNGVHVSTDSSDESSNQSEYEATENGEIDGKKTLLTSVKRGRGRPPKPKSSEATAAVVSGPVRQRGRPRKSMDPLSAVSKSPKRSSAKGPGRPSKPVYTSDDDDATPPPSRTGSASTITTTKMEVKTTKTTTSTKGSSSMDESESTTTSTTTESTTTTTVVHAA